MNILHVAAHLGGGAGKAISGMAIQGQKVFPDTHRVLLLHPPEKDGYVRQCLEHNIVVTTWNGDAVPLLWADVIVINWWNHPVMARFLRELPAMEKPLVLWSHINGCHYPLLPFSLAMCFDRILVTSPYSLENPHWTSAERIQIRQRADIVLGMGQFDAGLIAPKQSYHTGEAFVVGYVGTLNYGKIHPEFISYCEAAHAHVPNIKFVMVGDRDAKLEQDIQKASLAHCFSFTGFAENVPALLRSFDVFGYLLNPEHYGTTENVLLEAMAHALPVVAMNHNVEQFIVPEGGGYLVSTPEEYGQRLAALASDETHRCQMGQYARQFVFEHYHSEKNTVVFRENCLLARKYGADIRRFSCLGDTPWQWFLFCLEKDQCTLFNEALDKLQSADEQSYCQARELLKGCKPILRESRKSSLRHFAETYDDDQVLQAVRLAMREE